MDSFEHRCSPAYREVLARWDLAAMEAHRDSVYGLDPDLDLIYVNPAWLHFAAENGGQPAILREWPLERCVLDAVPAALKAYYTGLYQRAVAGEGAGPKTPLQHEYECSSPARYRRFLMTLYRLPGAVGLLVVNSLVAEQSMSERGRPVCGPDKARYADADGIIHQCAHCRRVENMVEAGGWDWVPEWVEKSPVETSHTLCAFCLDHYYPADD